MSQKQVYITNSLGRRIAEESQLLAEEKWIIDALTKIKNQRNSLQIERLHLESMKTQLRADDKPKSTKARDDIEELPSVMDLMQAARQADVRSNKQYESIPNIDEVLCNEQELNLNVTNSIFGFNLDPQMSLNIQEQEEEDDDDEADMLIDINMLMNAEKM